MKRKSTAIWLAVLLGTFGAHRFYVGQQNTALWYLVFCWTLVPAVVSLLDAIGLSIMSQEEFNMRYNRHFWL